MRTPIGDLEATVFGIQRPKPELLTLYFIYSLASLIAFPIVLVPLYFRYHTLKFRFDGEGVGVSYGILFRRETYLTYARIQDIHLTRNLFERWLGIGTVEIQTASSSFGAEVSIPGTDQFNEIRDYLYSRMRGGREHQEAEVRHATEAVPDQDLSAALLEAAAAMRETAKALRERGGRGGDA